MRKLYYSVGYSEAAAVIGWFVVWVICSAADLVVKSCRLAVDLYREGMESAPGRLPPSPKMRTYYHWCTG